MQPVVTFIATGMLTNSATHLVRIFQQQSNPPTFWGDITDLAAGGSDGFYDVADWGCESVEDLGSWLLDYMANCNEADILTPVYDPHGLLGRTAILTGHPPVTAGPPHLHQPIQPIPRNGTEPLKVGDHVRIVREGQDLGDTDFEHSVIEAPALLARLEALLAAQSAYRPGDCEAFAALCREFLDARAAVAKASAAVVPTPMVPTFTVFCQETGGTGTIHIDTVEAADLESAIIAAKQQCIDDWSAGTTEAASPWNMETVHCLGVAAGDVEILHWQDQDQTP